MRHSLRELNVKLDNEVSLGPVSFQHQLSRGVSDDVAGELAGHAFTSHFELSLRSDHLGRSYKDSSLVECVDSDGLGLQCVLQRKSLRVDQVVSLPNVVSHGHLLEANDEVRGLRPKRLVALALEDEFGLLREARLHLHLESLRVNHAAFGRGEHAFAGVADLLDGAVIEFKKFALKSNDNVFFSVILIDFAELGL